jgi:alkylhydroperoxidase family enzyme
MLYVRGIDATPRIAPGNRADIGAVNALIVRLLGAATGGRPPNLFTTLAIHRRLFRRWLLFAGALMPGGRLSSVDSELVILRVAHNCNCEYEQRYHERLGARAGLSEQAIVGVRAGAHSGGFTARQRLLLRAADELHEQRTIGDELWSALHAELADADLIELCLLIGHYEMLAMTINSLAIVPDPIDHRPPSRMMRTLQSFAERSIRKISAQRDVRRRA